jgi:hypothetical protein
MNCPFDGGLIIYVILLLYIYSEFKQQINAKAPRTQRIAEVFFNFLCDLCASALKYLIFTYTVLPSIILRSSSLILPQTTRDKLPTHTPDHQSAYPQQQSEAKILNASLKCLDSFGRFARRSITSSTIYLSKNASPEGRTLISLL